MVGNRETTRMTAINQSASEVATVTSHKYHELFPEVAPISSQKLIEDTVLKNSNADTSENQWDIDGKRILLVDVRSPPERKVSMIAGAISLHEFNTNVLPNLMDTSCDKLPQSIVMYCTIGYRSGLEGRKLLNEHPTLFCSCDACDENERNNLNDRSRIQIRNLDGILPFANALKSPQQSALVLNRYLVDPSTKKPTNKVHVYGPSWKNCLDETYEAVMFSKFEFSWRGLGVLFRSAQCSSCCFSCRGKVNKSR